MKENLIYVPCRFLQSLPGPATVTLADGSTLTLTSGRVDAVEQWLCVVARLVRVEGDKRRVRFADGREAVVPAPDPRIAQWVPEDDRERYYLAV